VNPIPRRRSATPVEAGDNPQLLPLSDQIEVARETGPGAAAADRVIADRAYSRPRRNVVERCFNLLTQFRGLATRYAERAAYYRAEVVIASFVLWLRRHLQDRPPR